MFYIRWRAKGLSGVIEIISNGHNTSVANITSIADNIRKTHDPSQSHYMQLCLQDKKKKLLPRFIIQTLIRPEKPLQLSHRIREKESFQKM